jgi:hypothetical protein
MKIVQVGWEGCNNIIPLVLICKAERERLGVETLHECTETPQNSVVKLTTTRAGISNSTLAFTELQFKELIGLGKVTINQKIADSFDLDVDSEVEITKPSDQETIEFSQSLQQMVSRRRPDGDYI